MSSILENIKSQYIDDNGKMRMITYSGISLMTSPLPPLNVPLDNSITVSSLEDALRFINDTSLEITMQDGDKDAKRIQGLWVRSKEGSFTQLYYGYIPIEVSDALEDVEFIPPTLNDPLRTDDTSELQEMHRVRKIADFLKQYTLYEYAQDPQKFSKDSMVVESDYEYHIERLNKRLYKENNNIMYNAAGKIIVPSKDIRDRLLKFLQIQLLNDTPGVLAYKDRVVVKDYYRTLSDFRKGPEQLIFLTRAGVIKWKMENTRKISRNEILTYFRPEMFEPYFYRNSRISEHSLMMIQNVEDGLLDRALTVAERWKLDRVNLGYRADIDSTIEKSTYKIYTENGKIKGTGTKESVSVVLYSNNKYAALLFF